MIIYVDMDNTIIDISTPWLSAINKKYKRGKTVDDIVEYDISKMYPEVPEQDLYKPLNTSAFWKKVEPIRGASWGICELQLKGHDVYIVTSTDYRNIKYKMENVIHRLFPIIDDKHVIFTHNKQLLSGGVMIDDYEKNLIGGDYAKILLDKTYNKDVDCDALGIHRALNWVDVVHIIERNLQ